MRLRLPCEAAGSGVGHQEQEDETDRGADRGERRCDARGDALFTVAKITPSPMLSRIRPGTKARYEPRVTSLDRARPRRALRLQGAPAARYCGRDVMGVTG